MKCIIEELEPYGLARRGDELDAMTDWEKMDKMEKLDSNASLILLGRFGEWKYYWSDDSVLAGKWLALT